MTENTILPLVDEDPKTKKSFTQNAMLMILASEMVAPAIAGSIVGVNIAKQLAFDKATNDYTRQLKTANETGKNRKSAFTALEDTKKMADTQTARAGKTSDAWISKAISTSTVLAIA